ncbi:MAG: FAD-binding protein [Bacteroidales bacterium]|jgi:FAD/FMN-containing dehydrogenase/Fe-S oxidoreductase|nr:FAD-binding protein [Bacteroidales bacterium]
MTRLPIRELRLDGEIKDDIVTRTLYATDASSYREMPVAVAFPKSTADVKAILAFAKKHSASIIPRTAGTSLAGQVVGSGIVLDVSRHMTGILNTDVEGRRVTVQPGVVLDELNLYLAPYGLFFAPETSTSNRCMIGGMTGNNSCGAHSLVYGSVRDHLIAVKAILSDGSEAGFKTLTTGEFHEKRQLPGLEGDIYRNVWETLTDGINRNRIADAYPDKAIRRRNHGYALDLLMDSEPFIENGEPFNFCKLLAGSEGTLCVFTELTLNLEPIPAKEKALLCVHFASLEEAYRANLVALKYHPTAVELVDKAILDLTLQNPEQTRNRFFVEGDPAALLMIELLGDTREEVMDICRSIREEMRSAGLGYAFPTLWSGDIVKAYNLRKAGLGVLSNMVGDAKPVNVVEDTAVAPAKLPAYLAEFKEILRKYRLECVYYAHIGTGELHLQPVLDIKTREGVELWRTLAVEAAHLVKKYKGSLSGEHGDGRLRGEFIPFMYGEDVYQLLRKIKYTWDPDRLLNPGKIIDTPPMNASLRFEAGAPTPEFDTVFDFSNVLGYMRAVEKCNGSGDCRKSSLVGGTLCPSYMASKDEQLTARGRANILRTFLIGGKQAETLTEADVYEVLSWCLSCKACKSECPSSVDMARLKAEFLQRYYDKHGIPLRSRLIANLNAINTIGAIAPGIVNFFSNSTLVKKMIGFAPQRSVPKLANRTLNGHLKGYRHIACQSQRKVYLFNDEFTNCYDSDMGLTAVKLLEKLGYRVEIPVHKESGRAAVSKGLLEKARRFADANVQALHPLISDETPLIGIEPSAILSFRDEYPELVSAGIQGKARNLARNTFLIDEFIAAEMQKGNITRKQFTRQAAIIKYHGHCQQKAVISTATTTYMLSFPENYTVEEIKSGCCGMAGSFGYEKEHYGLSVKIGEMVLFPEVRKAMPDTIIAASGTSCRHHIAENTGRTAKHPVEVLWEALV